METVLLLVGRFFFAMAKLLSILISTSLGVLFILSGILKMMPLEYLEHELLYRNLGSDILVRFESRLIIASEFILGAFLIARIMLQRVAFWSLLMLTIYTVYLSLILLIEGNEGNCGCFGTMVVLTPLEGILKNAGMMALALLLWKTKQYSAGRYIRPISIALVVIGLILPFILYPIDWPEPIADLREQNIRPKLDIFYDPIHESEPPIDLRKGKHFLCIASLKCKKCKLVTAKLELLKKNNPSWPIYLIVNGKKDIDLPSFIQETRLSTIPYSFFNKGAFLQKVAGNRFPQMWILEDGVLIANLDYYNLTQEELSLQFDK